MAHTSLPTFRFPQDTSMAQAQPPQHGIVTVQSPALDVMTDLTTVRAATVAPGTALAQAELSMIHQGVRLLFVVSSMPSVDGIITASDLHGERPLRLVHQRGLKYEELTVDDVMTPLSVIEHASTAAPVRIRGIISKTQVERQLGTQLLSSEIATSFAELEQALL